MIGNFGSIAVALQAALFVGTQTQEAKAQVSQPALSLFEFRGMTANTTEVEAVQRGIVRACKKNVIPRVRECALAERSLGGAATLFGTVQFRDGRMAHIGALISQAEFDRVKAALDQRYGPPCLQNPSMSLMLKVGRSYYWCFVDGAAALEQFSTGGMSKFEYYARSYDDIIGNLRPKVDF